jgi:hypothetical protein
VLSNAAVAEMVPEVDRAANRRDALIATIVAPR